MTEKIKIITIIDLLFLFILGAAGSLENKVLSDIFYYLAFLIPIGMGLCYIFKKREPVHSAAPISPNDFTLKKDEAILALPLIMPEIFAVLLISVATSTLMNLLGQNNTTSFNEPFGYAVLIHALIPAVLEELLFRFIPIKLIGKGEEKTAIILSSLMFAFAHVSLFQIPYAFVAGIIFASVYIATGSILPTVFMHFLNNLVSLMTIYGIGSSWLIPLCLVLLIISVLIIIIRRKVYLNALKTLTDSNNIKIGYPPILFAALSLVLSISVFFV